MQTTILDNESASCNNTTNNHSTSFYKPGDCVRTLYGVGVITAISTNTNNNRKDSDNTGTDDDDDAMGLIRLRLWRVPGQSIGSAAIAYLQPSTVRVIEIRPQNQL